MLQISIGPGFTCCSSRLRYALLAAGLGQSRRDGTICSPARQCREMEKRIPSPVRDGINAACAINPAIQIHASSATTRTL
jgi:hypothetical protein